MKTFNTFSEERELLLMSATSDRYEKEVADTINMMAGMAAERPSVSTSYPDVLITLHNNKRVHTWLEVKMNHTDNLSNPRAFYKDGKWQTTYKTPAATAMVEELNKSTETKAFIQNIAKFSGIDPKKIVIPTTLSLLKDPNAVPLDVMKQYMNQPGVNRYIMNKENYNLGDVVTKHYTIGKEEPAYYMQAADDFYMISRKNPLKLPRNIPELKGMGDFKVRVSTRSAYYEVQAEIKIKKMGSSNYSVKPGTRKKNPFT